MESSCRDLQYGQLLRSNLSEAELGARIKECPLEICGSIYGPGSSDLTSIGALISVAVQLALALLPWFGVFVLKAGIIPLLQGKESWSSIPVLKSKETKNEHALIRWLSRDHQSSAWHQLLFSLTIAIAGLIRQTNRWVTGVFESCSIIFFLAISGISLHVTTISYYGIIKRKRLFMFGYVVTFSCGSIAVLCPLWLGGTDNILVACQNFANEAHTSWKYGAIGPFEPGEIVRYVVGVALLPVSTVLWLLLRQLETKRGLEIHENRSHGNEKQDSHRFRKIMRTITGRPLPSADTGFKMLTLSQKRRVLYILLLLISGFHVSTAIDCFEGMMVTRESMIVILANRAEQNSWGIGQIAAPFVWVPLLIEMAYSAIGEACGSSQPDDIEAEGR